MADIEKEEQKPNINNRCHFILGQVYECCADCWRYDECKECAEDDE